MAQSLSKIYIHIVFGTKHRRNLIDKKIAPELFTYIAGICKELESYPVAVGGYLDHVHILCSLNRNSMVQKLVEEIKKSSSKWIKKQGPQYKKFYWQGGYGVFSVDWRSLDKIENYIKNQEAHHKKQGYKEEYEGILKEYDVDFDERYLWS